MDADTTASASNASAEMASAADGKSDTNAKSPIESASALDVAPTKAAKSPIKLPIKLSPDDGNVLSTLAQDSHRLFTNVTSQIADALPFSSAARTRLQEQDDVGEEHSVRV